MTSQPNNGPRLRLQLLAAVFARLVVNTAHRMPYAFLPVFSQGLGVSDTTFTQMLSARNALGITAPLFGPIPDRFGRRVAMLLGLAIFCLGMLLVIVFPGYPIFFTAVILIVICKFIFDPALQAYLGDRTPYSQRSLVVAVSEFGWSGAILVGMPVLGFLINYGDWRSPFPLLAALGVLAGIGIWFAISRDTIPTPHATSAEQKSRWLNILRSPSILATLSIGLVISGANDVFAAVYARWLYDSFGLSVAGLGLTAIVIGTAELLGEGLVALLADRLGKKRAVIAGLGVSVVAYATLCLPVVGTNLQLALAAIFFVFISFEFTIVSSIPLVTELVPEARSTVLSLSVGCHAAGRMVGPLIAAWAFQYGFAWNGAIAALLNLLWIPVILWWVKERHSGLPGL